MKITDLHEDGSSYVGSANIATSPAPFGQMRRRETAQKSNGDLAWNQSIKDDRETGRTPLSHEMANRQSANLHAAKAKLAKQRTFFGRLKGFLEQKQRGGNFRISESFDMQDVMSRLSGLESDGRAGDATVSFGIEDDDGNLMKVTVRSDQAEEFEEALTNELADAARRKEVTGEKTSISMAELLLKLNDEFDIVDASFPTIPTDGVYNADKVQYGVADTGQEELGGDEGLDAFPDDMAGGEMGGDPMAGGAEGDPMADPMGGDPMAGGAEGDPMADPMGGAEGDEFTDDGSVEDFPEEMESSNPEQNTLTAILDMLKAEAETRKAEADARAEEARAKQAEFTAMATKNAVAQEEEVARMEAEIEARKGKEKDAKRISDLARYRVSTASGLGEGAKPTFGQFLDMVTEFEEFDTVQSLSRQRSTLRTKYAVQAGDDAETIRYKREALMTANRELDAKIRHAQAASRYKDALARKEKAQPKMPQQSMTPQQQQQAQAQAAQQAAGNPNAL
jgi:hypothetical protein